MGSGYPFIYIDYSNSIWKFSINDKEELSYKIMYEEGKWTKANMIDKDVLGFTVYIEEDESKHIVYSNRKGELKYCTMQNKQWVGKTIYHMDSEEFTINDIKVIILLGEMHIFYMLIAEDGSDHAVLMHCRWNGKETTNNTLQDIILVPNLQQHYKSICRGKDSIDIFFVSDEGDEASLQYCSLQKNRWSLPKRLYGIRGENISFEILINNEDINILNRSMEEDTYLLDHVTIDINWKVEEFRVCESSKKQGEPLLFIKESRLYCSWFEQAKILYSAFDGEKWEMPEYMQNSKELIFQRYNFCSLYNEKSLNKTSGIYGTVEPDLHLIIPYEAIKNMQHNMRKIDSASSDIDELYIIKEELYRIRAEKKALEKKIVSLNMQVQKKQRFAKEYEDNIAKILEQKRKAEESCNVYLEVQQNIQKELEKAKQLLSEEDNLKEKLHKRIEEKEEEVNKIQLELNSIKENEELLQVQVKKLTEQNESLWGEGEKLKASNELNQLEINKLLEEKETMRRQIEVALDEKEKLLKKLKFKENENINLYEQLEFERNQSIMDRLLRRK